MLPNESLLHVLHFAEYETLVAAKLSGSRFLRIVAEFAEELAGRRSFEVIFYKRDIISKDLQYGAQRFIDYEPGNLPSLVAACRQVAGMIGPHAVVRLWFSEGTWNMPDASSVFKAAPVLKYAEEVVFYSNSPAGSSEGFMSKFVGMKSLRLIVDNDTFLQYDWSFLRQESAHELRLIECTRLSPPTDNTHLLVEEIVRYCASHPPRLQDREALVLDFTGNYLFGEFALRIIEVRACRSEA